VLNSSGLYQGIDLRIPAETGKEARQKCNFRRAPEPGLGCKWPAQGMRGLDLAPFLAPIRAHTAARNRPACEIFAPCHGVS